MNLKFLANAGTLLTMILVGAPLLAQETVKLPATGSLASPSPSAIRNSLSDLVPAAQAFNLSAFIEGEDRLILMWEMPPEFYLYRNSLSLNLPDGSPLTQFSVPNGVMLEDEYFGETEVYFDKLLLTLPLRAVPASARSATSPATLELAVTYQGCARDRYCYPMQFTSVQVQLP